MATFLSTPISLSSKPSHFLLNYPKPISKILIFPSNSNPKTQFLKKKMPAQIQAASAGDLDPGVLQQAIQLVQLSPPTWKSSILSNVLIFVLGSPLLVSGLSTSGIAAAFLLGTLTWRAFGSSGFLLVATYFVILLISPVKLMCRNMRWHGVIGEFVGPHYSVTAPTKLASLPLDQSHCHIMLWHVGTAATKVKMAQKEAQGVAEKRRGRRGPESVVGSSAAGCVCAFLSIYGIGGEASARLWELGFVASFCTKLSDTVASEIGKAYGKTTYLITTFKIVPRGTEGAVSIEGTFAGLVASIILAFVGHLMGQINVAEAIICVIASQIANVGESIIGAALQEKEGFQWLNNDAVNVINISMGSILAVFMQQLIL
ncbi:Protein vte6, chloroplastic [Orobanche minor]